jgi:hypothetical protein
LASSAIANDEIDFGVLVETNKTKFPAQFQWQNFQAGLYAIGIEPPQTTFSARPLRRNGAN